VLDVEEPTGHLFGEWYVFLEPTCEENGEKRCDCLNCGEYSSCILYALGHNLIRHPAKTPTCIEIGWNFYETCSACDYSTYEELPTTDHAYVHTVVPPTTLAEGYTLHTCSGCGDSYKDNFTDRLAYMVGDMDGSETVNKDDGSYLLMYTFFPEDYPLDQDCDFDRSGTVNKDDAIYLLMYTFFPEDYPLTLDRLLVYALPPASKRDEEE
jgi:hypothetical protein